MKTVYAVFTPRGKTLTVDGGTGGMPGGFCAYHGTFLHDGLAIPYMVLPNFDDPTKIYMSGCGRDPLLLNNFLATASEETMEAVTDPDVGLATGDGSGVLGWYDTTYGEVNDICSQTGAGAQHGTVVGGNGVTYVVQQGFSNALNQCVVSRSEIPALRGPGFADACRHAAPTASADAGLAADCLKEFGVALGKTDGSFGENDPLVRSQVSSLLARLIHQAGVALTQTRSFPDTTATTVPNSQVRDEIEHLAGSGIIAGFPDGLFHPNDTLTVAQAATLVVRTLAFIHANVPGAPDVRDQGTTAANYEQASAIGLLDPDAPDLSGFEYSHQPADGTNRGLLAGQLAHGIQQWWTRASSRRADSAPRSIACRR